MAAGDRVRDEDVEACQSDGSSGEYVPAGPVAQDSDCDMEERRTLIADGSTVGLGMAVPRSARAVPVVVLGAVCLGLALYGVSEAARASAKAAGVESLVQEHSPGSCLCNHHGLADGHHHCGCHYIEHEEHCNKETWCEWTHHTETQGVIEWAGDEEVHPLVMVNKDGDFADDGAEVVFRRAAHEHVVPKTFNLPEPGTTGVIEWAFEDKMCMKAAPCECTKGATPYGDSCRCIELWECGDKTHEDMQFEIPEGVGEIRWGKDPTMCMWLHEAHEHEQVKLHNCEGHNVDGHFEIKPIAYFDWKEADIIKNRHGLCLESKLDRDYSAARMGTCTFRANHEQWMYDHHTGHIRSSNGLCLDSPEGHKREGKVVMYTCHNRDHPNYEHQHWHYDHKTGEIKHGHGYCLHAPEHDHPGSRVHMMPCNHHEHGQRWVIHSAAQAQASEAFEEVTAELRKMETELVDDPSFTFLVGDKHGILYAASMGSEKASRPCKELRLHDATRMLTGMAIGSAVAKTHLRWHHKIGQYLDWWTSDHDDWRSHITFETLLTMTSGLGEHECVDDGKSTLEECTKLIYENGHRGEVSGFKLPSDFDPVYHPERFWSDAPFIVAQAAALRATGHESWHEFFQHFVGRHVGLEEEEGKVFSDHEECDGKMDGGFVGHSEHSHHHHHEEHSHHEEEEEEEHEYGRHTRLHEEEAPEPRELGSRGYDFVHPSRNFASGATGGLMSAAAYGRILAHALEVPEHYDLHEVLYPHEQHASETEWIGSRLEKELVAEEEKTKHCGREGQEKCLHRAEYGIGTWVMSDHKGEEKWYHSLGDRGFLPAVFKNWGPHGMWVIFGRFRPRSEHCSVTDYNTAVLLDSLLPALEKAAKDLHEMRVEPPHISFEDACEIEHGMEFPYEPVHLTEKEPLPELDIEEEENIVEG